MIDEKELAAVVANVALLAVLRQLEPIAKRLGDVEARIAALEEAVTQP